MPPDAVGDIHLLISEAKVALARFGGDLSRFNHLLGREEIARFGRDLTLLNQLLALISEHMRSMQERLDGAPRRVADRIARAEK